jgi:hypothetical protein
MRIAAAKAHAQDTLHITLEPGVIEPVTPARFAEATQLARDLSH